MTFDAIEQNGLRIDTFKITDKLSALNKGFKSSLAVEDGVYVSKETVDLDSTLAASFKLDNIDSKTAMSTAKGIWKGYDVFGNKTLSLDEISSWKINPEYKYSNYKQHAGYLAEVMSTQKDNLIAIKENTGIETYRIDDLPDHVRQQINEDLGLTFKIKNDQIVDKIQLQKNADGKYIEYKKIQSKFVGKNADECLSWVKSSRFDKYYENDSFVEIPKDYYKKVSKSLEKQRDSLKNQIETLEKNGDSETLLKKQNELEKIEQRCKMIKPSSIDSKQPVRALKIARAQKAAFEAHSAGLEQAKSAAALTAVVSGVDNIQKYYNGEITGTEAIENVAKDTAVSSGIGYVSGAATKLAGGSNIPAAVITMGVASYGDVKDFADGKISGGELAYDLGENAASVVGGAVGAAAGTLAGSVAGPVGSFAGGLAGGAVGSAAATKAYGAGVEFISENIDDVKDAGAEVIDAVSDKAVEVGEAVAETAAKSSETVKETAADVREAVSDKLDDAADKAAEVKDAASKTLKNAKVKVTNVIHKK